MMKERAHLVDVLNRTPNVPQGTTAWLELRKGKITGSAINKMLEYISTGKDSARRQYEATVDNWARENYSSGGGAVGMAAKWGHLTEDLALRSYRLYMGMPHIYELSLVPHKTDQRIAASPDGITENGVLVECKSITSRVIFPGQVKTDYYSQIQLQMECTGLSIADFCEIRADDFKERDAFLSAPRTFFEPVISAAIMEYEADPSEGRDFTFVLSPEEMQFSPEKIADWVELEAKKKPPVRIYWAHVRTVDIQRVYRDDHHWKTTLSCIDKFCEDVENRKVSIVEENKQKKILNEMRGGDVDSNGLLPI